MKHHKVRIKELKKLHYIALKISPVGKRPTFTTMRTYFAEQIFEKTILIANSYLRLIPNFDQKDPHQCDFSSLASLSRNLIELNHIYNYLCKNRLSKEELEFRIYLMGLHNSYEVKKILQKLNFSKDYIEELFFISNMVCQSVLDKNSYFNGLNERVKKELRKGKKAFYQNKLGQKYFLSDQSIESGLYKLFSNHIHSFQLGIQTQFFHSNEAPLNLISLFFLSTEFTITCYADLLRSYMALRWKMCKHISEEDKVFVKHCRKKTQIKEWVKYQERNFLSERIRMNYALDTTDVSK